MKATRAVSRGPNRPAFSHRFRQRGAMELVAVRAPVGQALVLRDDGRRCGDFHLLQNVGRTLERPKRAAAIGAAIQRVGDELVDGLGRKRRPQVLLMARLPAPLALLAVLRGGLGGLTISLEGGLEEVEEFLRAAANCCFRRSTSSRSCRFSRRSAAFSSSNRVLRSNTPRSFSSSTATRRASPPCSASRVVCCTFMMR